MNEKNLVWMDLEMTGLEPDVDRILEVAVIITDENLNVVAEGPVIVLHQSDEVLASMDAWNIKTHGASGLINKVKESCENEESCQKKILDFIKPYIVEGKSPLCGNSIWQDRRFIAKYLPQLDKYLLHRNIDVSSVKELFKRWTDLPAFEKNNCHEALSDIKESIAELEYYRQNFFVKK